MKPCEPPQRDLDRVYDWSETWRGPFNPKKCSVLLLTRRPTTAEAETRLGADVLPTASSAKVLGPPFDARLSYADVARHLAVRVSQALGSV